MKIIIKSFEGHQGIPGHQGGSLPKGPYYATKARPSNSREGGPPRVYGGELYRMPNEDRPEWGVHGGGVHITAKGQKIVDFIAENQDYFRKLSESAIGSQGKYVVRMAIEYSTNERANWGESDALDTMSSAEASGNFNDIAILYNSYLHEYRDKA